MTTDDKIKLLIGELTLQNIFLRTENEQLKAEKEAGEKKKEPEPPR